MSHFSTLEVRANDGAANVFTVSTAGAVAFASNLAINTNKFTVAGTSGNTAIAGTLGVTGALTLNSAPSLAGASTSGTIKTSLLITPVASAATGSINFHKLFAVGDVTGNTAFGFGDATKPTTGAMFCFGRPTASVATGSQTDTAVDIRAINNATNTTGVYNLQGLYIKAKNYADKTLTGALTGLYVETVPDGTVSGESIPIRLGSDGKAVTRMIDATNLALTKYASNKTVVLLKFTDAAGTVQYLIHNTDAANAVSVTSSAPS